MIAYLLVCETKAFKLDLAILLVNRKPGKKLEIKTVRPRIYMSPQKRFKDCNSLLDQIYYRYKSDHIHRWNSMLQATSKLNLLEYLDINLIRQNLYLILLICNLIL